MYVVLCLSEMPLKLQQVTHCIADKVVEESGNETASTPGLTAFVLVKLERASQICCAPLST